MLEYKHRQINGYQQAGKHYTLYGYGISSADKVVFGEAKRLRKHRQRPWLPDFGGLMGKFEYLNK